jgi:hypothetical protein
VIRSVFFAAAFGAGVAFMAARLGATAGSALQAALVGLLSSLGFFAASVLARGRVRRRQGAPPEMAPGEAALLYGPGELKDSQGSLNAWFYLSNQRLRIRGEGGEALDLGFSEIEELRPAKGGFFKGEFALVARGRGLLKFSVPDAPRWHAALRGAMHAKAS